jgi:hypothetical protein
MLTAPFEALVFHRRTKTMAQRILVIDPNNHDKVMHDCLIKQLPDHLQTLSQIDNWCREFKYDYTISSVGNNTRQNTLYIHGEDGDLLEQVDPHLKLPSTLRAKLIAPLYEVVVEVTTDLATGVVDILWFSPDAGKTKYVKETK